MKELFQQLFGPLDQSYCNYFLFLSILGFVLFAVFLISFVALGITQKKPLDYYLGGVSIALTYFIFGYFQNRLLHSMCAGTLIK